jgi:hypothetical protein
MISIRLCTYMLTQIHSHEHIYLEDFPNNPVCEYKYICIYYMCVYRIGSMKSDGYVTRIHMYIYVYRYIHTFLSYIHTCIYTYIYKYMNIYIHISYLYTYKCTHLDVYTFKKDRRIESRRLRGPYAYIYIYIYIDVYICACIDIFIYFYHIYIHAYIYTYLYIYIYIYIQIYIYVYISKKEWNDESRRLRGPYADKQVSITTYTYICIYTF